MNKAKYPDKELLEWLEDQETKGGARSETKYFGNTMILPSL